MAHQSPLLKVDMVWFFPTGIKAEIKPTAGT